MNGIATQIHKIPESEINPINFRFLCLYLIIPVQI